MTGQLVERVTRAILICAALTFAVRAGCDIKDDVLEQMTRLEMESIQRWREQYREERMDHLMIRFGPEEIIDTTVYDSDPAADLL